MQTPRANPAPAARFAFRTASGGAGLVPVVLSALVVACGGDPPPGDAGPGDALPPSTLYGPCVHDSQCPGEGAVCRRDEAGFPRGYCTVPCDDRTPCDAFGVHHHCVQRPGADRRYCELRCLNGLDCGRDQYTCVGRIPPSGGLCIGICGADSDCSPGHECDRESGRCHLPGMAPTGASLGEPCTRDESCRSRFCVEVVNEMGTPTGWVDGACLAYCIVPEGWNSNNIYDGPRLPSATCPDNAVCFPQDGFVEGNVGVCIPSCSVSADCRLGYACLNSFQSPSGVRYTFENGICIPIDCSREACPPGYRCVTVTYADGSRANVCAP
jgi:hypothetical protein